MRVLEVGAGNKEKNISEIDGRKETGKACVTLEAKVTSVGAQITHHLSRQDVQNASYNVVNSHSASRDNWCTVGGNGGCRVSEVRAGTTSPMPDHKGFKLQ